MIAFGRLAMIAVAALTVACGQKGPPLAPLHLVPAAPASVSVARAGGEARLRFDVPSTNQNGPGAVALDRIEVYAATVAPGAVRPANRELLTAKYRVATIPIKPPPVEGEAPPANPPADNRPSAGERSTFVEALTEETVKPVFTTPAAKTVQSSGGTATTAAGQAAATPAATATVPVSTATPAGAPTAPPAPPPTPAAPPPTPAAPATTPPATGATPTAPPATATTPAPAMTIGAAMPKPEAPSAPPSETPAYAARIYTIRGVTKSGRPGPPSTRVELPLVMPPAAPLSPVATATEKAIVLTWSPPTSDGAVAYNIYKVGGSDPITSAPVSEGKYERAGVEFGTEECFMLRAVQKVAGIDVESDLSPSACVTPRDTFPPAAPKGLSVVAGTGTMNLGWDANTEPDLAGYLVLRGEAPGDTLQPLTRAPITGTSYEDKTVRPGVRYVYAIVAVDKASTPNTSAPSARVAETAR